MGIVETIEYIPRTLYYYIEAYYKWIVIIGVVILCIWAVNYTLRNTEGFTKVVATIVIVLLAIIFIGYILIVKLIDPHSQWPPTGEISQCPDYWTATSDGCCLKPANAKNKFIGPDSPVCFNDDKYKGAGGIEAKKSWVEQQEAACKNSSPDDYPDNMCKLYWDGVTNSTVDSKND